MPTGARMTDSCPVAPPTSQTVLYLEKSNAVGQHPEPAERGANHRLHELFEPRRVFVQSLEE